MILVFDSLPLSLGPVIITTSDHSPILDLILPLHPTLMSQPVSLYHVTSLLVHGIAPPQCRHDAPLAVPSTLLYIFFFHSAVPACPFLS